MRPNAVAVISVLLAVIALFAPTAKGARLDRQAGRRGFTLPYPPDSLFDTFGASELGCNGHGMAYYMGPDGRYLCKCYWGWKGPACETPFAEKDYGPFKKCTRLGARDKCEEGMGCNLVTSHYGGETEKRCACNVNSKNKACQWTRDSGSSCRYYACGAGLACTEGLCLCTPFSTHPMCQCSGNITLSDTRPSVPCTRGPDGYCVVAAAKNESCSFAFVGGEGAGAMAACEPGMGMNIYGECVCLPLSTNDKCRSKPPANQNAGMVCARYQPCRRPYGVEYTVLANGKAVATANASVEALKPYAISTAAGIVPDREYVVCTRLTDEVGWDVYPDTCNGGSRPGQQCCMTVTASRGPGNFTLGCADFSSVLFNSAC